jgi:DNA-binding response OmpR family regulator
MTPERSSPRVLVVEDDDNIASALLFILNREGLHSDRIASGAAALPRIRETHPDLVLLDVMLPEVSGYDICLAVRHDRALASVKILMMTARGSTSERQKALALGADGFVTKPFDLSGLRAELNRLLRIPV